MSWRTAGKLITFGEVETQTVSSKEWFLLPMKHKETVASPHHASKSVALYPVPLAPVPAYNCR
jgi:hypothetical protein